MKVYTKTGDRGTTSLVGGTRVAKNDPRLEAYGTIDELNSWIGYILAIGIDEEVSRHVLTTIQNKLFDVGSTLATEFDSKWQPRTVTDEDTRALETEIDRLESILPSHDRFILPGGAKTAAAANIARTVCRRAERNIVSLPESTCPAQTQTARFVNRLSDYLFVLGRYCNFLAKECEIFWDKDCSF